MAVKKAARKRVAPSVKTTETKRTVVSYFFNGRNQDISLEIRRPDSNGFVKNKPGFAVHVVTDCDEELYLPKDAALAIAAALTEVANSF